MRRQRMIGRLAEERGFLGGRFQKLLVLVVFDPFRGDYLVILHDGTKLPPSRTYRESLSTSLIDN